MSVMSLLIGVVNCRNLLYSIMFSLEIKISYCNSLQVTYICVIYASNTWFLLALGVRVNFSIFCLGVSDTYITERQFLIEVRFNLNG